MDRKKDIISGGETSSTVEVESVIYRHPDVLEVAVIPIPDPKWGEVPKVFVGLREATTPKAEDIVGFCIRNLARFKGPKAVEFGELPETATGRIQKFKLRDREWAGRERRVN
jgi:fatty-acyl-CoA synthase